MVDSEGNYFDSATLGEGSDCESCGWNGDSIRVEEIGDGSTEPWFVYRELGCYSGYTEYFGSIEEVIAHLENFDKVEYLKNYYSREEYKQGKQELSDLIEGLKTHAASTESAVQ